MMRVKPYPQRKVEAYRKVLELAKRYPVIALANVYKIRAMQINELRKRFRKELTILSVKNTIAKLALEKFNFPDFNKFKEYLTGQNIFIFTMMDPFKLYLLLEKNKVNLPAKAGDVATDDIILSAGNTGLAPGPILSEFKELGIPTRIESGSIWISKDTLVAKKGDVISQKLASLLSKLNMKPIRAGISIKAVLWNGQLLRSEDVKIDIEAIRAEFEKAANDAIKLAYHITYPIKELLPLYLREARDKAMSLALNTGYPTSETIIYLIQKAHVTAEMVMEKIRERGYGG